MLFSQSQQIKTAERSPDEVCDRSMFENGYYNWSDTKFRSHLELLDTFEHILEEILPDLIKTPTPMKPNPITPATQLAITLYRLAHGCSLSTLEDIFGWSIPTNDKAFNYVCRVLAQRLYDRYVRLPKTEEEWTAEIKGLTENYEFPCVGAWDGFHVYVSSQLKSYFSFKKRYSISNMGLAAHNKRFLYAAAGAPGSFSHLPFLYTNSCYASGEKIAISPPFCRENESGKKQAFFSHLPFLHEVEKF